MMTRLLAATAVFLLATALACGTGEADDTPTPVPASTPTPEPASSTPTSTATPRPSPTPPAPEIDFAPKWTIGQRWGYELFKTSELSVDGDIVSSSFSESEASIEAVEATAGGFVVTYTLESVEVSGSGDPGADSVAQGLAELTVGLTFEIELSPEGKIVAVRNPDRLVSALEQAADEATERLSGSLAPADAIDFRSAADSLIASFGTSEGLLSTGLRDMDIFTLPFGWKAQVDREYRLSAQLPNPLGGPPIPATAFLLVIDSEPGDDEYTVDWLHGFEGEEAEQALFESLKQHAAQTGGPAPTMDDVRGVSRDDGGDFTIDTATGTLKELFFVSTITSMSGASEESRTETTEFILLP